MPLIFPVPEGVPAVPGPPMQALQVPLLEQQGDEWCWAACLQMILQHYGDFQRRQCEIADTLTGDGGCCTHPRDCDKACPADAIAWLFQKEGLTAQTLGRMATFSQIEDEIAAQRPVLVLVDFGNGAGHLVLLTAAESNADGDWLMVNDPLEDQPQTCLYAELLAVGALDSWIQIERN